MCMCYIVCYLSIRGCACVCVGGGGGVENAVMLCISLYFHVVSSCSISRENWAADDIYSAANDFVIVFFYSKDIRPYSNSHNTISNPMAFEE